MQVEAAISEPRIENERGTENVGGSNYGVMRYQIIVAGVGGGVAESYRYAEARDSPKSKCRGWQRKCVLLGEAPENRSLRVQVVVDADIALIPVLAEHGIGNLIVCERGSIG